MNSNFIHNNSKVVAQECERHVHIPDYVHLQLKHAELILVAALRM